MALSLAELRAKAQLAPVPSPGQGLQLDAAGRIPASLLVFLPGYEFGSYVQFVGNVSVAATTSATATTVVTANPVTFDGATDIYVEFFCDGVIPAGGAITFVLYDGSTELGQFGGIGTAQAAEMVLRRRLTPTAASHTYSVRAFVVSGTGTVIAGAGSINTNMPGYIRIVRA